MNQQTSANSNRNDSIRILSLFDIFRGSLANGRRRIARWRKHGKPTREKSRQSHRNKVMHLEALEPRMLLSADLVFNIGTDHDIGVQSDGTNILIVNNLSSTTLASQSIVTTAAVHINGSGFADKVTIDLSTPFDRPVFFDDGSVIDHDNLIAIGVGLNWELTGADTGHANGAAGIFFTDVEALHGDGSNPDSFTFLAGASSSDGIDGGAGNFDTLHFGSGAAVDLKDASLDGKPIAGIERAFIDAPSLVGNASGFSGQVFLSTATATWVEEGPRPYTQILSGSTEPWDPVAGAIQTIAIDPSDRFTMYIGTTNGGVWRNTGSTQVFFGTSDSSLDDTDKAEIDNFARFLLTHPDVNVEVGGHTDSSGDPSVNNPLSLARATSVRDYLVNTWKISTGRLTVVGFGEDRPVASNGVSGDQPLNRRVELLVQNWEPVTQDFPSLSIGSIAISTASSQTIYAGTSRTSSFGRIGGFPGGILFSDDGGDHWRLVADPLLNGLLITKVLPTTLIPVNAGAEVVFVSTFDTDRDRDGAPDDRGGVFRLEIAADGTLMKIDKVSNVSATNGLPRGDYTDLAFDPGDGGARKPAVYAVTPGLGIFKFTELAGTFTAVNTGVTLGDSDGISGDDLFQVSTRVQLAIHPASGVLYAGFIGKTDANGIFNLAGKKLGLIGLFKTANGGTGWTSIAVPTTLDGAVTHGLHPGGQGDTHFGIAVDPTDANVVYVSGDAQPANSVTGQGNQAGRIFRLNGGAWVQVIGNTAGNTAPHADSRGMVFVNDFTLLEIDDGGLARLQSPRNDTNAEGQGKRQWASLDRGMGHNEVLGMAFDNLNGTIQTGAQDNGSAIQVGTMDGVDNDGDGLVDEADERFFWQGTFGGDGNSQAVIGVDTDGDAVIDRSLHYLLHNNYNFLLEYEVNASGQFVDAAGVPGTIGTPGAPAAHTILFASAATPAAALSGLSPQDQKLGFDKIPMVVNSVNQTRMLIGSFGIYESINTNINPPTGQSRVLPLDQVRQLDPAVGVNVPTGSEVTALVFGGVKSGTPNAEVVLAARGKNVLFRSAATGPDSIFQSSAINDASVITALAVDPDDWRVVYAADAFDVYRNDDITVAGGAWTKITGNLGKIGQGTIQSLQFIETGGADVLLVGGRAGVDRLLNPGTATGDAVWTRFGENLPNAPVSTLEYVDRTQNGLTSDDILLAATMGRGVWSMAGASLLNLGTESVLTVLGRSATTDTLSIAIDAANPLRFDIVDASEPSVSPAFSARFATYSNVQIDTRGGADALTVNHGFGAVAVPGGIDYDGGADTDTLTLNGGPVTSHVTTSPSPGVTLDTIKVGGKTELVRSKNLGSPIVDSIPAALSDAFTVFASALDSAASLLTFRDGLARAIPLFGTSLGTALNGIKSETGEPLGEGGGGVVMPLAEQVREASGQTTGLLRRFIETGTGAFSISDIATFTTLAEIESAFLGLNESGSSPVVSHTGSLATGFEITLSGITKRLSGEADVDVDLDVTAGSIHLHGLVDMSADVTLNLTFGLNNTDGFYVKSTGSKEIVVSGIQVAPSQQAVAEGAFGFLGVTVSDLVLAIDPAVHYDIDLANAKLTQLESNPALFTTVTLVGNGASLPKDVSLTGKFDVAILVPGLTEPFSLGLSDALATIAWTDITAADLNGSANVSVDAGVGAPSALMMEFLKINVGDFASKLTSLKTNLDTVFGAEVPFLSDGLTELVDLATSFQHKVIDPISGLGGNPTIPSIQSLVSTLAQKLDLTPDQMGLAFNPANGELTYHLVLNEPIISATKDLGAGVDFAGGLADLQFSSQATVDGSVVFDAVFGVDLDQFIGGGDPLDAFFLRDTSATLQADISASDIEASARFGFLSIGIDQGALTAAGGTGPSHVFVTVVLKDPGTNAADGRVDLSEIGDNLDSLGNLIGITGGGSLQLVLPVETTFVPSLSDIPNGTATVTLLDRAITITVPDLTTPSTIDVVLGSALTDVANFKNIDAVSMVGVLGQLTYWLDQFRQSDAFAKLDLPLIGPALDQALQFADNLRDGMLIDDKDNGVDDKTTLLFDLNTALESAGLGRKLYAANDGGKIKLVALDAAITAFTVTGAVALGFDPTKNGTKPGGKSFAEAEATNLFATINANVNGRLLADLTFGVTIGTKTYTVKVKQSDTDTGTNQNTRIGDDEWKLVNAQNAPTFATAQEMVPHLLDALGLGHSITYDPGTQSLNFSLDLSQTFADLNLPLNFDVKNLPPYLQLQTSGALALKVSGGLNLEVGVFLGSAEPSDKLQDGSTLPATLLADLSQPLVIGTNQTDTANPVVGKLTGDATFKVFINGDLTGVDVTVTKLAAQDNLTVADMVADINAVLTTAGLAAKVVAQPVPAKPGLVAPNQVQLVGIGATTTLKVTASTSNPAVTEIGLPSSKEVTGASPTIVADKTLPALKGRLTGDAGFTITLNNGTSTDFAVLLTVDQTKDNNYPFSIISDIEAQLNTGRIKVDFSRGALTFASTDGSTIAVSNVTGKATNELGIVAGAGNGDDLAISVTEGVGGTVYRVSLDGATTVADVIDKIEAQTSGKVTVTINAAGSGLDLKDETFGGGGTGKFKVETVNNSTAGLLLGIIGVDEEADAGDTKKNDGLIKGSDIAALTALDRFFVKSSETGTPLAGLSVDVGTPSPITAAAKFGFVALGLQGEGGLTGLDITPDNSALNADMTLRLKQPAGSTDGRVSLAEMIGALKSDEGFNSLFDLSLTGQGQLNLSLTPATKTSLAGLGIGVGADPRIEITADMSQNVFAGNAPLFNVATSGFDDLANFGNVDFNFQSIVAGINALIGFLDQFEALSFLNDPIPVIDVSLKDLVSFVNQFADAVTAAQSDPAGSLQVLEGKLQAAFGLPSGSPLLHLTLVDGPIAGHKVLKIDTQLSAAFSKSLPINLDLGLDPLQFGGNANLLAEGSAALDLDFGIDVNAPTNLYVFDTTGITATLDLAATDLNFKAAVGPLGVFVENGSATINGTLGSNKLLTAGFNGAYASSNHMSLIQDVSLGDDLSVNVGGALDVTLPVFFPTESVKTGTVKVTGNLSYTGGTLSANLTPSAVGTDGVTTIALGDLFKFDPGNLSLLDQLLLGVDGIDTFLGGLQDLLDGQLGGFSLPLVGDKLSGAAAAIGDFRNGFVEGFRKTLEDLANPALAFAEAGIAPGTGGSGLAPASVPQGVDPVSKMLWQLLGPDGLHAVNTKADIVFDTNIKTQSDPKKVFFDWKLNMGGVIANVGAGIGFDLGIPGLGLETEGAINFEADWKLDFGFGINFDDGFYLDIGDNSELEIAARVTTPGLEVTGKLGFLQISAEENVEAVNDPGNTGLAVQFGIDIYNRQDKNDQRLGFAELGRMGIDAKIAGEALADLQMSLKLNSDLVSKPGNFPSIVADFLFQWGIGTVDNPSTLGVDEFNGVSLSDLHGSFLKDGLQYVGFDHVGLDLGKYFSDVIGPIVDKVQEVTGPIKPFLDFLTEPIPVISDLAGPTSLLDIAAMSGEVNPGIIKAIETVDQVVDIVSQLKGEGGDKILYFDDLLPDGALTIYKAPTPGLAAASAAGAGIDLSKPFDVDKLKGFVDTLPKELGPLGDVIGAAGDAFSKAITKMRPGGAASGGFKLPIIEDPSQIFGMLMGQPADLITFTMAPLELKADFSAFFSIFGPLGVSINAEFGAQFGPFTFGYDTYGITQFAGSDFKNPELLFDGLYIGDLDARGVDINEMHFDAGLWAAAELNLGIARGGVGGGLFAEINFNLYDPNHDGKVRVKELVNSIENAVRDGYSPVVAPLAVFDISGKLTAELFAFLKIDIPFFPVDEKFLITDPITLLSFENAFVRRPTLATELGNGVLQLNIGKNAAARTEGDLTDGSETIHVTQGSDANHVYVWSDELTVPFANKQEYEVNGTEVNGTTGLILAYGGEGDDVIDLAGVTSGVKYELHGDAGNDKLTAGTAGTGAALLIGGTGNDELRGGAGGDTLIGEAGDDKLWGGTGADWLLGDGNAKEYRVGSVITVAIKGSDGADELHGDAGDDLLIGGGGMDTLVGDANNDVLIGDGGEVSLVNDTSRIVATTRELDGNPATNDPGRLELAVRDTSKNGKGAIDNLDGGTGNDHLYGGFGNDVLKGGDGDDVIYGELGSDTVDGGGDNDVVFGDFGRFVEVKVGLLTTLEPEATSGGEKDDLSGGSGDDKLLGGGGNDKIQGNDGNDSIWGGTGQDQIWGDNENGTGTGNDFLYGEADSDKLYGGNGKDYLEGGGGNDLALGGAGEDTLVAGYGSDTLDGEDGSDTYRISVRGGTTTEMTTAYDTGAGLTDVDSLIVVGTQGDDTLLLRAMADSYFPTLEKLNGLVERFFRSTLPDRLAGMLQSFNDAYGPWDLPSGLISALTTQYQATLTPALDAAVVANRTGGPDEPSIPVIQGLIHDVLASNASSKIDAMEKAITAEYARAKGGAGVDVPNTLFSALIAAYMPAVVTPAQVAAFISGLQAVIAPYYVAESRYPRVAGLKVVVDDVYADSHFTTADTQFAEIEKRIADNFGSFSTQKASMLAALQSAWDTLYLGTPNPTPTQQKTALKLAIDGTYTADPVNPNTFSNTAFVAVINDSGQAVERFNYRRMEGLVVSTLGGNDYVVLDDLLAAATINLGDGNDRVQVGQVFRSERVKDPEGELITGIRAEDVFASVEITRGWLSDGVSVATTINGGDGDDNFTVFRNVAVLNLNGGDGDDVFTVRAFALKGSSDNERARTDMKGDGGADTILYVVNAPVGIDGGDGFDTVRIVGTEFGDDFVITDSGIFGAGLNVSYVNVERLVADGAEGDDRFFVMSTGLDVVTEIDGGLGNDTFFVGGNPSRAPVPVVSNDLRGHSGIILHSVTAASDAAWAGLPVEGLSANVADNEESMILVGESGGRSMVVEGAIGAALGATDTYRVRLSRAPSGKVVIAVVGAGLSPEEEAKNYADLEYSLNGGATWSKDATVELNAGNWSTGVEVMIRAIDDVGIEGRRFTFINHKVTEATTDVTFLEAQARSVKVQMEDNDRDGVIVVPSGLGNTVLENGFADNFQVMLNQKPGAPVTVTMTVTDPTYGVSLSTYTLNFEPDNTNGKIWSTPQAVTVSAINDTKVEGFHTDFIQFNVVSTDHDEIKGPFQITDVVRISGVDVNPTLDGITGKVWLQIDGNPDDPLSLALPSAGSTYALLPNRPVPGTAAVRVAGVELDPARFALSGNTITFLSASGAPEQRTGTVEVNYQYKVFGYDKTEVRDQYVDIYDNDSPAVIIVPAADNQSNVDGMLDVVEGDPSSFDTYKVSLSKAPTQNVVIVIDSAKTRTTWGANAYFEKQVLLSDSDETNKESITLTFTPGNWNVEQTVTARAIDDARIDGNDTQVFAPDLQTVNKIRGPLIIEGAAGAGSLSLPSPLMMPWERNVRPSDGNVLGFQVADKPAGAEYMTVELADLDKVVARFKEDDPTFIDAAQLVGKTLEMSKGAGTGIVLDPSRPDDKFDRFWLITKVEKNYRGIAGNVRLTLQNPTAVDPTRSNVIAPDDKSEYAITSLSVNFFADEREQVDYLFVYDNDSVADDVGALTSSDGAVLDFSANTMRVNASSLQGAATLLGVTIGDLATLHKQIEITVGPGQGRIWTIASIADYNNDPNSGQKVLTLTDVSGAGTPTNRSEFRIDGSDRHGRITGLGMGPNVLFAGQPQGGGITYGDIEVVQVELGTGNDKVRVDYATNAEDHATVRKGDFYTQTILKTGGGNDEVTVTLANGDGDASGDGAFALDTGAGNDKVFGAGSTRSLVVFGGEGDDEIHTGSDNDIVFGDIGRVDYTKKIDVNGIAHDSVITRLGSSVPQNPVNPHVTFATNTTVTDAAILGTPYQFPVDDGGLAGLSLQIISPEGHVQFRTIIANTADTITVDVPWDEFPVYNAADPDDNYYYRVSSYPDDQTDGLFRGPRVIWSVKNSLGGKDKLFTGAGDDIAIGGTGNDEIDAGTGADRVAGDDARFDYVPVAPGSVRTRLATISDLDSGSSGDDTLWGGDSKDILIGGLGKDKLYGQSNDDVLIGDTVTISFDANGLITQIAAPADQGGANADELYGGDGRDIAIGGAQGDRIDGGNDVDMLIGDAATIDFNATGDMVRVDANTTPTVGGADDIRGDAADDVLIGGAQGDRIDGGTQDDLLFGDNVVLLFNPSSGDAVKPRFRNLGGTTGALYDANGNPQVGTTGQSRPGSMPAWADWHITLDQSLNAANFGNDYIAGGANDDTIFGQRGDDTIQGDGSTSTLASDVNAYRKGDGTLFVQASVEATTDGDDYIEGNAGKDIIFGNLGQDDLIGGSSTLFSLTDKTRRDDAEDLIFGGAGTDIARNDLGDGSHARDADMILGDNGNIYRIVSGGVYRQFNYDALYGQRIIVRAADLLDYTPGGPSYSAAAAGDHGKADELHGESGDDFIYGMTGNDAIFGEGQDDDIVGGYGNDWISGGTGDDGVLGDDGRIFASRNSSSVAEALYGILAIPAAQLNALVADASGMTVARINVDGTLKYTADLTPYSVDPANAAPSTAMPRALYANDMIYGGLGNDSIHGGAGEDAISGAEALLESYVTNYTVAGARLGGLIRSDYAHPFNPGNVLGYNPVTTKFALYDANDPLRKILLTDAGLLSKTTGKEWALNFSETAGPLDAKWAVGTTYPALPTDGDDVIFGDVGHDWLVGGTGRDSMWAGWGDDLVNADDNLTTGGGLNKGPDTNPSWEDFVYGGAGLDVLIANTGGDRLVDWGGEYNTYVVPYNPFGEPTVARLIQPALEAFLYALSKSQGADQTLAAQYGTVPSARNGEPFGELGVIRQGDAAWGDQHGGPRDPQGPNAQASRDVRVSAGLLPFMMEASGGLSSASSNGQVTLTAVALTPTVQEAIQHWIDALGANDPRLAKLKDVTLVVADLPDGELGRSMGNEIVIDVNAAGYGWYVDVTPADNAEFSIRVKGGALTATPNNAAYAHMDLVTVVTHELGHILGFDHADAGRYAVMHEDLDPGVRVLIDQRAFDYFAQPPLSEQNLLRAALQASQQEAWNKAGKNSLPAFNVDTFRDIGRAKGSIDWNDRFLGGWGASPFGNGAPRSGPNFSDFLGKVIGSGGDGSGDDRDGSKFDKLGGALNAGKYAKVAKGGGR